MPASPPSRTTCRCWRSASPDDRRGTLDGPARMAPPSRARLPHGARGSADPARPPPAAAPMPDSRRSRTSRRLVRPSRAARAGRVATRPLRARTDRGAGDGRGRGRTESDMSEVTDGRTGPEADRAGGGLSDGWRAARTAPPGGAGWWTGVRYRDGLAAGGRGAPSAPPGAVHPAPIAPRQTPGRAPPRGPGARPEMARPWPPRGRFGSGGSRGTGCTQDRPGKGMGSLARSAGGVSRSPSPPAARRSSRRACRGRRARPGPRGGAATA